MGAKQSSEMKTALLLVKRGATGYAAAAQAGITRGALYRCKEYKEIIAARKEKSA